PGYGLAEAPKAKVEAGTQLVRDYLRGRPTLLRVLLLVDARHGLKSTDAILMTLMDEAAVSYQAVLTKTDKVAPSRLSQTLAELGAELATHPPAFARVLATSARTGGGIDALRAEIAVLAAAHAPASAEGSAGGLTTGGNRSPHGARTFPEGGGRGGPICGAKGAPAPRRPPGREPPPPHAPPAMSD